MQNLGNLFSRQPVLSVAVLLILTFGTLLFVPTVLGLDESSTESVKNVIRYAASFTALGLLFKLGWARGAGITTPASSWGKHWWLAALPMSCIGLLNLGAVDFGQLEFNAVAVSGWVFHNFGAGLFEEVVLRGLCFYILYRVWAHTRGGLYKAAFVQALIFGLLHLFNLRHDPVVDVVAQVIYATLIGIGFAGIVAYVKSLWVPVIMHAFINAMGKLNEFFVPGFVDPGASAGTYVVAIVLIFFLATIPGLWCLKKAPIDDKINDPT